MGLNYKIFILMLICTHYLQGAPNPDSDSTTVITTGQTTVPTTTPGTTSYSGKA